MADRFSLDPGPDPRAVAYLEGKGLQRSWRWTSMFHEQHAFGFTLAGVYRLDVLGAAKQLVTQAVEKGETYQAFRTAFQDRMNALGFAGPQLVTEFAEGPRQVNLTTSWRMKTIYDTNVRAAYAASEWQGIDETKADFPALEYQGVRDERTRASHLQWFGTVRLVDDVFWKTHYPPNDWRCRCWVVQISIDELAGGSVKLTSDEDLAATGYDPDPSTWPTFTDTKTGRSLPVPPDIGPGFAYNAGQARRQAVGDLVARKVERLDPDMARAAAFDLVNLPQFADLASDAVRLGQARAAARARAGAEALANGAGRVEADRRAAAAADHAGAFPADSWPVGVVPAELAGAQGGTRVVVANASAIGHSADAHPTTPADWRRVQQLLEGGEAWRSVGGELALFGTFITDSGAPQLWTVALKPVDGAWRVRTMFPTSPRRRARITAGRELLRGATGYLAGGGN